MKDLVIEDVREQDQSHSASFPRFLPPSTSPPSHPALRMMDERDIENIKSATMNTRSAFAVQSLPPATAQGNTLGKNHKTTYS